MNWKLFWAGLAIGAAFLAATAKDTDVAQQIELLRAIPLSRAGWFVAGCAFHFGHLVGRGWRWRLLFPPPRPSPRRLFSALSIGYLYNNLVPRSGELVRMLIVGKWVPALGFGGIAVTVAVERLVDVLMVLTLTVVVLASGRFSTSDAGASPQAVGILIVVAVSIAVGVTLAALLHERLRRVADGILARCPTRVRGPLGRLASGVIAGLEGMRKLGPRTLAAVVAMCCLDFLLVNSSYRMLSRAFSEQMISFGDGAWVMVGSGLGAMVPSGPGNVGTMIFFMTRAASHTSMAPAAAAYGFTIFLTYYLVRTSTGLVCLALETRRARREGGLGTAPAPASSPPAP